ncbi:MAG: DUF459 domain-containing protein [Acidimicrobiia bacterium]
MTITDRPPSSRNPDPGRRGSRSTRRWTPVRPRPLSAGQVLIVGTIAMVLASLLNATSLASMADRQPYGWKRSLARSFTTPLEAVSSALSLDRPHRFIDDLQNKRPTGSDSPTELPVSTALPAADSPSSPSPTAPVTAPSTATEPADGRTKIWLGGDSMANDIGTAFTRLVDATKFNVTVDAHVATGLTRPDYFDWPAELQRVVKNKKPSLMIMMVGGNDGQTMLIDGIVRDWNDPVWQDTYRARVANIMDFLVQGGRKVIWVGQPNARSDSLTAKMAIVDDIYRTEAQKRPSITFIDTKALFAGPDGGYSPYLPNDAGEQILMRQGDGFHLNLAGANKLAKEILKQIG